MRRLLSVIFILFVLFGTSQESWYKGWGVRGDVLGVSTDFLGSTDNRSWYLGANNNKFIKIDSVYKFIYDAPSGTASNKVQISQWTAFTDIPAIYVGVATPSTSNYAILGDGSSNVFNAPATIGIRSANTPLYQGLGTYTSNGIFNEWLSVTVATVASNNGITTFQVDGADLTFSVGTTTSIHNVNFMSPTYRALTTATLTDAATLDVTQPTTGAGMTMTRKWAARFAGAGVFTSSLSVGSTSTALAPANMYVVGTQSNTGALTVGGTITGSVGIVSTGQTQGIGYAAGSGSTVTQGTNRTTGVTINAINGAITLVSAAGQTGYQSFVVTNSSVAATDVIIVNQKSGTDKNIILVTAVGASSFTISFATTGGTTTEQPVFNFAVIKAVTN